MKAALLALMLTGAPNLLEGTRSHADLHITDGVIVTEGERWLAPGAVKLKDAAWPQWDLGTSRTIAGAALQADNNDSYIVELSEDGQAWTDVFTAGPVAAPGLRTRSGTFSGHGRFVRLRAEGGDGRYSVSELQLFASKTDLWTSPMGSRLPRAPLVLNWTWLLVATAIALSVVNKDSAKKRVQWVGVLLGLGAAWVIRDTWMLRSVDSVLLDWIRCVVAVAALLAVVRTVAFWSIKPAPPALVHGVLGVTSVLAVLCFLNFARPQFYDTGRNTPTFLHFYDMRAYYPIAKYFTEVRFDGVYAASAAAVEEDTGLTEELAARPMTNLRTHARPTVGESQDYIREVRARFSPERWSMFVNDMRFFRQAMSDHGFLDSMQDHGGNATPVWLLGARAVFRNAPASNFGLWTGVVVDSLLVVLAFVAIGWAYGPKTALLAMTVFGAMDLYMFSSNWFGAALRHDWMALWGIGLALLKKERFFLGGGLLAWAALIRVFPLVSFVTLTAPIGWTLGHEVFTLRRGFSLKKFVKEHESYFRVALGALAFGLVLIALSVLVFGFETWPLWVAKITLMAGGRGVNTVGLTNFVTDPALIKDTIVLVTLVTLFALRKAPLHEAAAFAPVLVPVLFSPMNYYLHSLFLLVMVGKDERVLPWLALLAMCVGCYWSTLAKDGFPAHFDREAWVVLATTGVLVLWRLVKSFEAATPTVETPAPIPQPQ